MAEGRRTREFAGGAYFPGSCRVLVRDLSRETVRDALDEIVRYELVPAYFGDVTEQILDSRR